MQSLIIGLLLVGNQPDGSRSEFEYRLFLSEFEQRLFRSLPDCVKRKVWDEATDRGWAFPHLEVPDWDNFDGVVNVVRRRAVNLPFPWPIDPIGPHTPRLRWSP